MIGSFGTMDNGKMCHKPVNVNHILFLMLVELGSFHLLVMTKKTVLHVVRLSTGYGMGNLWKFV